MDPIENLREDDDSRIRETDLTIKYQHRVCSIEGKYVNHRRGWNFCYSSQRELNVLNVRTLFRLIITAIKITELTRLGRRSLAVIRTRIEALIRNSGGAIKSVSRMR